jgi:hypothetical protein
MILSGLKTLIETAELLDTPGSPVRAGRRISWTEDVMRKLAVVERTGRAQDPCQESIRVDAMVEGARCDEENKGVFRLSMLSWCDAGGSLDRVIEPLIPGRQQRWAEF